MPAWDDLIAGTLKFLLDLFISPQKKIQRVHNIFTIIHKILDSTDVERVLIYKTHNGGGKISPRGDIFFSVLYEDYIDPFESVKQEYQSIAIDKTFIKVLLDVMQDKRTKLSTSSLEEGFLKGLYIKDGVKNSIQYYLGSDRKGMYFVGCSTSQELPWMDNPGLQATLDLEVQKIKQNLL